ncbi:3-mercaptopyruvate sulfurtransferase-like [Watersipora subatra]|uniref:3-mercaptopyruvate sulfurtransferase-like n=1 Tax=Watersipora subatra TaxID=2589382 RepID=UPI00355BC1A5
MHSSVSSQKSTSLISVSQLTEFIGLSDAVSDLVILDVSVPMPGETKDCYTEFKQRHIPGARFFDLNKCKETNTENEYMLPTVEKFKKCVERFDIKSHTTVVVYDANKEKGMFSSPRAWFMFMTFGHKRVYVIDGGLMQWLKEGRSTETGDAPLRLQSNYSPGQFRIAHVKCLQQVKLNIVAKNFQLLDARSPALFHGSSPELRPDIKPGHIPGSKCLFWIEFLEDGVLKSPEKLVEVYKAAGVDPKSSIVATCNTGMAACFIKLTCHMLGNSDVAVYDGSWVDWFLHAPDNLKIEVPK